MRTRRDIYGALFHWVGRGIDGGVQDAHDIADATWVCSLTAAEACYLLDWIELREPYLPLIPFSPPCCAIVSYELNADFQELRLEVALRLGVAARRNASKHLRTRLEALLVDELLQTSAATALRQICDAQSIVPLAHAFVADHRPDVGFALRRCVMRHPDGDPARVAARMMIPLLGGPHRMFAAKILAWIPTVEVAEAMAHLQHDPSLVVRGAVATLFSQLKIGAAEGIVLDMMRNDPALLARLRRTERWAASTLAYCPFESRWKESGAAGSE